MEKIKEGITRLKFNEVANIKIVVEVNKKDGTQFLETYSDLSDAVLLLGKDSGDGKSVNCNMISACSPTFLLPASDMLNGFAKSVAISLLADKVGIPLDMLKLILESGLGNKKPATEDN